MDFDANEYLNYFLQDAEEHLEIMTDALLALEQSTDDTEAMSQLFRVAHTLKSSSAMVGLQEISDFTHHIEDFLSQVRDGERVATEELVTALFQAFDLVKAMLESVQEGTWESRKSELTLGVQPALARLQGEAHEEEVAAEPGSKGSELDVTTIRETWAQRGVDGSRLYLIDFTLQPDTPMPTARALLVIQQVETLGEIVDCVPDIQGSDAEVEDGRFHLALATVSSEEDIRDRLENPYIDSMVVRDISSETDEDTPEPQAPVADAQVKPADTQLPSEEPARDAAAGKTPPERATAPRPSAPQKSEVVRSQTVRVDIGKLDTLLELVGELVIARGQVTELGRRLAADPNAEDAAFLVDSVQAQGMILTQLQEAIMDARMVPVGNVLTRFRRLVRDLSHGIHKNVRLEIEGEETELDKKIIDFIGDPLTHLIRNAIDHGLEGPDERAAAGKSKEGRLLLAAGREGNNVTLTVSDDGRGLNVERIRQKALERDLMTAEAAEQMDDHAAIQMIFQPGFSTAERVTDVSGRGVGMDVVNRVVEELGGEVVVKSKAGEGSSFVIRLPLTLAIIQALLIEVGNECYALPISDVLEMLRLSEDDITTIEGRGEVIRLRDQVIPLIRLHEVLQCPAGASNGDDRIYVAVIQQGQRTAGLVVDSNRGEQEIVIKSLGSGMEASPLLAGASILGDGEVVLILDTMRVIRDALQLSGG